MVLFNKWAKLLLVGFILYGCHGDINKQPPISKIPKSNQILNQADSLLGINPDKALKLSQEIIRNEKKAEPGALLVQAKSMAILNRNDEASKIISQLITLAGPENKRVRQLAKFEMGRMLYYQGQYDSALVVFTRLLEDNSFANDSDQVGWTLLFQGKSLRVIGQYHRSQDCYLKAKDIAKKFNDQRLLATVLISIGKNHIVEGNRELALKNYLEAFRVSEPLPDYLLFGDVCNHLGGYYLLADQYDKALEYHNKSLKYRIKLGAPDEIGQSYNNIGRIFLELGQDDSARYYFNQSVEQFSQSHYMKGLVKSLTNLGKLNLHEKKFKAAKANLTKAYSLAYQSGYNLGVAETGIELGNFYLSQSDPDSAIHYYQDCLDRMKTLSYEDLFAVVYKGFYKAYTMKGNYKMALGYHEKLLEAETDRLNVENNRQMAGLLLDFDYERKEKDNHILKKENEVKTLTIKRNRLILWFTVIALLFSVLLSLLIYSRLKFKEKANKQLTLLNEQVTQQNQKLEILNKNLQKANQDKDKLFSIISHELRNPLFWFQNLTAMLSKNFRSMDETKLQKSITSLNESAQNVYHLMDNLLYWSRSQLNRIVPRKSEFLLNDKINEISCAFKNIMESKEIQWISSISPELKIIADPDLLACIIRNLLSNAIKFTPNQGVISLEAFSKETVVYFTLTDTGLGFPDNNFNKIFSPKQDFSMPGIFNEKGSGFGLKLCKEFVEIHQGQIWFESNGDKGCKVCFTIQQSYDMRIG